MGFREEIRKKPVDTKDQEKAEFGMEKTSDWDGDDAKDAVKKEVDSRFTVLIEDCRKDKIHKWRNQWMQWKLKKNWKQWRKWKYKLANSATLSPYYINYKIY